MRSIEDSRVMALDFVNRHFSGEATVLLTGSSVDRYGKEGSDIDLIILSEGVDRYILYSYEESGFKFDVFLVSRRNIGEVLEEEGYNARGALLSMIIKAVILKDEEGIAERIVELGKCCFERGYLMPGLYSVQQIENRIRRKLESLDDGKEPVENLFLVNDAVDSILDLMFLHRLRWLSTGKVKARQLKEIDPIFYTNLENAYRSMLTASGVSAVRELLENKLQIFAVQGSRIRIDGRLGGERLILAVGGHFEYYRLAMYLSDLFECRGGFGIYYLFPYKLSGNLVHVVFRDLCASDYQKLESFLSSALGDGLRYYPVNANAAFLSVPGEETREWMEQLFSIFHCVHLSLSRSNLLKRSNAFQYALLLTGIWLANMDVEPEMEDAFLRSLLENWMHRQPDPFEATDYKNWRRRRQERLTGYEDYFDQHMEYYNEFSMRIDGDTKVSGGEEIWRVDLTDDIRRWWKIGREFALPDGPCSAGEKPGDHYFLRKILETCLGMLDIPERDWGYLAFVLLKFCERKTNFFDQTAKKDDYEKISEL